MKRGLLVPILLFASAAALAEKSSKAEILQTLQEREPECSIAEDSFVQQGDMQVLTAFADCQSESGGGRTIIQSPKGTFLIYSKGGLADIQNGRFYFKNFEYAEDDARCCPSIETTEIYLWDDVKQNYVWENNHEIAAERFDLNAAVTQPAETETVAPQDEPAQQASIAQPAKAEAVSVPNNYEQHALAFFRDALGFTETSVQVSQHQFTNMNAIVVKVLSKLDSEFSLANVRIYFDQYHLDLTGIAKTFDDIQIVGDKIRFLLPYDAFGHDSQRRSDEHYYEWNAQEKRFKYVEPNLDSPARTKRHTAFVYPNSIDTWVLPSALTSHQLNILNKIDRTDEERYSYKAMFELFGRPSGTGDTYVVPASALLQRDLLRSINDNANIYTTDKSYITYLGTSGSGASERSMPHYRSWLYEFVLRELTDNEILAKILSAPRYDNPLTPAQINELVKIMRQRIYAGIGDKQQFRIKTTEELTDFTDTLRFTLNDADQSVLLHNSLICNTDWGKTRTIAPDRDRGVRIYHGGKNFSYSAEFESRKCEIPIKNAGLYKKLKQLNDASLGSRLIPVLDFTYKLDDVEKEFEDRSNYLALGKLSFDLEKLSVTFYALPESTDNYRSSNTIFDYRVFDVPYNHVEKLFSYDFDEKEMEVFTSNLASASAPKKKALENTDQEFKMGKVEIIDRLGKGYFSDSEVELAVGCDYETFGDLYSGKAVGMALKNGKLVAPLKNLKTDCNMYNFLHGSSSEKAPAASMVMEYF